MRRVYYGETAYGKTRECIRLAKEFSKQGLWVVSNIQELNYTQKNEIDPEKEIAMYDFNNMLMRIYKKLPLEKYPWYNYSKASLIYIRDLLNYIVYYGDVLILDDAEHNVPGFVLSNIMRCIGERGTMLGLWKHVIVSGYSESLKYLLDDFDSPIYFVNKDGNISKIAGQSNIEDRYWRVVRG